MKQHTKNKQSHKTKKQAQKTRDYCKSKKLHPEKDFRLTAQQTHGLTSGATFLNDEEQLLKAYQRQEQVARGPLPQRINDWEIVTDALGVAFTQKQLEEMGPAFFEALGPGALGEWNHHIKKTPGKYGVIAGPDGNFQVGPYRKIGPFIIPRRDPDKSEYRLVKATQDCYRLQLEGEGIAFPDIDAARRDQRKVAKKQLRHEELAEDEWNRLVAQAAGGKIELDFTKPESFLSNLISARKALEERDYAFESADIPSTVRTEPDLFAGCIFWVRHERWQADREKNAKLPIPARAQPPKILVNLFQLVLEARELVRQKLRDYLLGQEQLAPQILSGSEIATAPDSNIAAPATLPEVSQTFPAAEVQSAPPSRLPAHGQPLQEALPDLPAAMPPVTIPAAPATDGAADVIASEVPASSTPPESVAAELVQQPKLEAASISLANEKPNLQPLKKQRLTIRRDAYPGECFTRLEWAYGLGLQEDENGNIIEINLPKSDEKQEKKPKVDDPPSDGIIKPEDLPDLVFRKREAPIKRQNPLPETALPSFGGQSKADLPQPLPAASPSRATDPASKTISASPAAIDTLKAIPDLTGDGTLRTAAKPTEPLTATKVIAELTGASGPESRHIKDMDDLRKRLRQAGYGLEAAGVGELKISGADQQFTVPSSAFICQAQRELLRQSLGSKISTASRGRAPLELERQNLDPFNQAEWEFPEFGEFWARAELVCKDSATAEAWNDIVRATDNLAHNPQKRLVLVEAYMADAGIKPFGQFVLLQAQCGGSPRVGCWLTNKALTASSDFDPEALGFKITEMGIKRRTLKENIRSTHTRIR